MSKTFNHLMGGGSSGITAFLTVKNCYVGSTVIASNGTDTFSAVADSNGEAEIEITSLGLYQITAPYKYSYSTKMVGTSGNFSMYVHNVPQEYQEVEYLESTGTQWIKSNYIPNENTRVECEARYTENTAGSLFGARTSNPSNSYIQTSLLSSYSTFLFGCGNQYFTNIGYYDLDKHTFYTDSKNKKYGWDTGHEYNGGIFNNNDSNIKLVIFGLWHDERGIIDLVKAQIFGIKAEDLDGIAFLYTPCYRKSDGVAGMWDAVSGQLFTNQGTGEFICGVPVNSLPVGYKQVEYIQSTGFNTSGQYINTGIKPNINTGISAIFTPANNFDANSNAFGTSYNTNDYRSNTFYLNGYNLQSQNKGTFSIGDNTNPVVAGVTKEQKNSIMFKNKIYTRPNGETVTISNYAWDESTKEDIGLFAKIIYNGHTATNFSSIKLYLCRLFDLYIATRDYVPCIDTNNVVGLYDVVSGAFYENSGTGVFIAGSEVHSDAFMEVA